MTKGEVLAKVSKETMISRSMVDVVIDSFIKNIEKALENGDNVVIRGFGEFCNVERKARNVNGFNDGEMIYIPAHIEPVFKVSDALKKKCYKKV